MGDPQIYVRGFPKYTSEEDLRNIFSTFGDIKEIRMIRDYAFIVTKLSLRYLTAKKLSKRLLKKWMEKTSMNQESRWRLLVNLKNPKDPNPMTSADCAAERVTGIFVYIIRKNDCPDLRRDRDRKKRRRRSPSSSSSGSSSSSSSGGKKKK